MTSTLRRSVRFAVRAACVAMLASFASGCGSSGEGGASGAVADVKGDPARGEALYQQCAACHSLQANGAGPRHCELFGRPAGTVPDFEYSQAMRESGLVWNVQTLDEFLTSPITYVSGTKMGFAGFSDAAERADVIAYLHQVNHDPASCPAS